MGKRKYKDIAMPEAFVLEFLTSDGEWMDHGLFRADQFGRDDDGTYVCAGHGGSPLFLRCLRQDGMVIYTLDGGGDPFTYRLYPFPSDRYSSS